MTDEELEQQDKQEQKEARQEETKKTLKTVITSVICTLLFVVILLLLVILCLKNCSNRNNNNNTSSSNSTSEPTWSEYDNSRLTNVFKGIVIDYLDWVSLDDSISDVLMVSYVDRQDAFDLSIFVKSNTINNRYYYYQTSNKTYTGFTNFLEYLLDNNTNLFLDSGAHFETMDKVDGVTTTRENSRYVVVTDLSSNPKKHVFGSYFDNNIFYVYNKAAYVDNSDPFTPNGDAVTTSNLLYGYYRSLYQLV